MDGRFGMNPCPWHEGRLVAFDVETTGVDVESDRIVTAAIAVCGGGLETETLELLADPGVEISEEAAGVHGVTTERARAEGAPARVVVAAVLEALRSYTATGSPIVAFNARFDLTILDREARRHGLEPLGDVVVVDPLVIDKWLDRYRKGSRKLEAICATYGAGLDQAHDAAADALAAARAAWVLGAKGRVIRKAWNPQMEAERAGLEAEWERVRHDLALLHEAQVRWAWEQADGLAEYFREQGNPDADKVERDWPLVPCRVSSEAAA